MTPNKQAGQQDVTVKSAPARSRRPVKQAKWQKPSLEDVSGKVMAQPYIRFT
jgi:hypothetical protein